MRAARYKQTQRLQQRPAHVSPSRSNKPFTRPKWTNRVYPPAARPQIQLDALIVPRIPPVPGPREAPPGQGSSQSQVTPLPPFLPDFRQEFLDPVYVYVYFDDLGSL